MRLHTYCILLVAFILSLLSGCNEIFQPLKENDRAPFSIFGYLDVSADTQWVRVTPVREQINLSVDVPADMDVTLEEVQSGSMEIMNDSLFFFPDGFHILNAWTATDILKPEHTYRLRAERPDGVASSVTVTFPKDFPTPRLEIFEFIGLANLYIKGIEQLIAVQSRTRARVISESAGWNYVNVFRNTHQRIDEIASGEYQVRLSISDVKNYVYRQVPDPPNDDLVIEVLDLQMYVASGGPEWKEEFSLLNDREYSLPNAISNVENGVGYVFGIVSKSIPFENCFNDQGEHIACPAESPFQ